MPAKPGQLPTDEVMRVELRPLDRLVQPFAIQQMRRKFGITQPAHRGQRARIARIQQRTHHITVAADRGEALRVVQMPYVEAARASGTNDVMMIIRHILPNVAPQIIVQATISLAFAILAEAGLSFLGLGTQPPQSSWGLMIQASRDYLDVAPWTALVPGAAVALTVLGLNMFGDVLRDVLDPRVRG